MSIFNTVTEDDLNAAVYDSDFLKFLENLRTTAKKWVDKKEGSFDLKVKHMRDLLAQAVDYANTLGCKVCLLKNSEASYFVYGGGDYSDLEREITIRYTIMRPIQLKAAASGNVYSVSSPILVLS